MRSSMRLFSTAFVVLVGACARDSKGTASWVARDSSGVRIAESKAGAWSADSGWRIGPAESEFGADSAQGAQFADVGFVSVMSDGRVVVTDVGTDAVVLFTPTSGRLQTIARKGAGPGEVSRVFQAWVGRGDSIVTWDFGNRRVQFFSPDGRYVRAASLDARVFGLGTFPIGPLPDGNLLLVSRSGMVATDLPPGRDSATYFRLSPDSLRVVDTLAVLPDLDRYTVHLTFGGQAVNQRQVMPFGRSTDVSTTPSGFIVADNGSWEIREYDAAGKLTNAVRRDVPAQPVATGDVDEYRRTFEEVMKRDKAMPPELVTQLIADSKTAPHGSMLPVFLGARKGLDGTTWVRHYDLLEKAPSETFSVFEPSGRYLGDVTLPDDTKLAAVGADYILLIESTSEGGPVIRRHPLMK